MTTQIRAVRFRIRRRPEAPAAVQPEASPGRAPVRRGVFSAPIPAEQITPRADTPPPALPDPPATAPQLAAVMAEGLTSRQLRMARRVAMRHSIAFETDHDAVIKLRQRGIDPFRRAGALDMLAPGPSGSPGGDPSSAEAARVQLPQTVRPAPPPAPLDEGARIDHIMRIQRDIVARRRRKIMMLAARLTAFVLIPTLLAGLYYFLVATPLYATKSEFVIQQAESPAMGNLGGFFKGTQFATSQDSITVQSYLQSREAMMRLDQDLGFRAAFSGIGIDPINRIAPDATREDEYKVYKRNVKISYDPTEGIIKMEVIAPDPQLSRQFSEKLIHYAEEQVDRLSLRLREDQMKGARDSFEDAERKVALAQQRVLDLQQQVGILDPMTENSVVMSQISTFEVELRKKQLELQQLLDNAQPNQARVDGVRGDIDRLQTTIADLRAGLTKDRVGATSLATSMGQLRIAEGELESRQLMLGQALQQMETARIEANRQTRYLSMGVNPLAPDAAAYPRAFENTILALLVFSGIYLMLSLTAAILREQVTS